MQKEHDGREESHHDKGGYDPEAHDNTRCPICGVPTGGGAGRPSHIRKEHS